jgi:osmotically-inducible protein OsmY
MRSLAKTGTSTRPFRWRGLCSVALASLLAGGFAMPALGDVVDVSDVEITNAIENEMLLDEAVESYEIDVTTTDGIVQFSGKVDSILEKDRAEAIASHTVGVRGVVNEIAIEPDIERDDAELRNAVEDALLRDPATESYEVSVSVTNGTVSLAGTVDSWQERELCGTVAKGVSGVRGIENILAVDYKTDRPDFEIKEEIEARMQNDILVDDLLVDVQVDDGEVTLDGSVGSLAESYRARSNAWVSGVSDVDTSNLDIEWGLRDDMRRVDTYVDQTDEDIRQAINDAFLYDPRVRSFNPEVTVKNGAVTLSGVVHSLAAKQAAEADARNIAGVRSVRNNLKVRIDPVDVSPDLESAINIALANDPYVESYQVDVSVNGSWVTLTGDVNTSFEKWKAFQVASGVEGVTRVFNNIDFEHEWTWQPDSEIKDEVKDQLWWSPFVDSDDVNVEVDNGVATLTGTVDTWSERQDAEENAYEGGAKDVDNNLNVDNEYYGPYRRFDGYHWSYPYSYQY